MLAEAACVEDYMYRENCECLHSNNVTVSNTIGTIGLEISWTRIFQYLQSCLNHKIEILDTLMTRD